MSEWRCKACGCKSSECECLDEDDTNIDEFPENEEFIDAASVLDIEYDR